MRSPFDGATRPSPFSFRQRIAMLACVGIAIALFVTALHYQAIATCYRGTVTWFDNDTILWFGWGGVLFGQFGWYANIPFVVSLIHLCTGRPVARRLPIVQGLLAFSTFIPVKLAHNEGYSEKVCAYGLGLWLWLLAQSIVIGATVAAFRAQTPGENAQESDVRQPLR